jgi:hypothetical protein
MSVQEVGHGGGNRANFLNFLNFRGIRNSRKFADHQRDAWYHRDADASFQE